MDPTSSYANMSPFAESALRVSRNNSFVRNRNEESTTEHKHSHKKLFQRPSSQLDEVLAPKTPTGGCHFESMYSSLYQ